MTTSAVVMMIVAMLVVWGGLALSVYSLNRNTRGEPGETHRDL